ncbi:MAG: hypothetical protein WC505_01630 [Patescibacteria group bacterium]
MAFVFVFEKYAGDTPGPIAAALTNSGHFIHCSRDPDDAFRRFTGVNYAAIIIDLTDCRDSMAQDFMMRVKELYPTTPVIVYTQWSGELRSKSRVWGFKEAVLAAKMLLLLDKGAELTNEALFGPSVIIVESISTFQALMPLLYRRAERQIC